MQAASAMRVDVSLLSVPDTRQQIREISSKPLTKAAGDD
jgi:hypothetical protein